MEIQKRENIMNHLQAAEKLGEVMAKSGMFGVRSAEQGFILALTCAQENITPLEFSRKYHIIDGKPTMRADAMLAEFCKAGGKHVIKSYTDKKVEIEFIWQEQSTAWAWDISKAKRAGLDGRNNWKKYPEAMLFSRCVSEALKRICPELFHGLYTPEELQPPTQETIDIPSTPVEPKQIENVDYSVVPAGKKKNGIDMVSIKTGEAKFFKAGTPWVDIPRDYLQSALKKSKDERYKAEIEKAIEVRRLAALTEEPSDLEGMIEKFHKARKNKAAWADKIVSFIDIDGVETLYPSKYFNLICELEKFTTMKEKCEEIKELCAVLMSEDTVVAKGSKRE